MHVPQAKPSTVDTCTLLPWLDASPSLQPSLLDDLLGSEVHASSATMVSCQGLPHHIGQQSDSLAEWADSEDQVHHHHVMHRRASGLAHPSDRTTVDQTGH